MVLIVPLPRAVGARPAGRVSGWVKVVAVVWPTGLCSTDGALGGDVTPMGDGTGVPSPQFGYATPPPPPSLPSRPTSLPRVNSYRRYIWWCQRRQNFFFSFPLAHVAPLPAHALEHGWVLARRQGSGGLF